MPGRKNPKMTESEREREYHLAQKRGYGDTVVGERGASLDDKGETAEIERRREKWAEDRQRLSQQDF